MSARDTEAPETASAETVEPTGMTQEPYTEELATEPTAVQENVYYILTGNYTFLPRQACFSIKRG